MADQSRKYRDFLDLLKRFKVRELSRDGAHRTIGNPATPFFSVVYAPTDNFSLGKSVVRSIRHQLRLQQVNGVSDDEFYRDAQAASPAAPAALATKPTPPKA